MDRRGALPTWCPLWAPPTLLTALALWLRLRALPGAWGDEALALVERALSGAPSGGVVEAMVRGALRLGGGAPAWAAVPGAVLSAAVAPLIWLAARPRLGAATALLPAALWAFLGLELEAAADVSIHAMAALPAALALMLLARTQASRASGPVARREMLTAIAAGLLVGTGAAATSTTLLSVPAFIVAALCLGAGRRRVVNAAALLGAAVLAVLVFGSFEATFAAAPLAAAAAPGIADRLLVDLPAALLTDASAWGLLTLASLPLLARLPSRALRGDPAAAVAVLGVLSFVVLPVLGAGWAPEPATPARALLVIVPALLVALAHALVEAPATRAEGAAALLAAVGGFVAIGQAPLSPVLLPPALLLTAWSALPQDIALLLSERRRVSLAAAALVISAVAWPRLGGAVAPWEWVVVGATGLLVTLPWLVARPGDLLRVSRIGVAALAAALVLATAVALARFVPDPSWDAWRALPSAGTVHADERLGRRLRIAAPSAGADATRLRLLAEAAAPPDLGPGDRLLARDGTPLARASIEGPSRFRLAAQIGDAVLLAPAQE